MLTIGLFNIFSQYPTNFRNSKSTDEAMAALLNTDYMRRQSGFIDCRRSFVIYFFLSLNLYSCISDLLSHNVQVVLSC